MPANDARARIRGAGGIRRLLPLSPAFDYIENGQALSATPARKLPSADLSVRIIMQKSMVRFICRSEVL